MKRYLVKISGLVQGVGFRPFVFRLASKHGLTGFVSNTGRGVEIEIQGSQLTVETFIRELRENKPRASFPDTLEVTNIAVKECDSFEIASSKVSANESTVMPRDLATCCNCLVELFDKKNRRYLYPFITCNDCGPRFTITEGFPFDRGNTTMRVFTHCELCKLEYEDPADRRFHAQTISCPKCGPQLEFKTNIAVNASDSVSATIKIINSGGLVAVKGVGGYQLICLASSGEAINRIRKFKNRKLKPLAVMAPSLQAVESSCFMSHAEKDMLTSSVGPIVLLYSKPSNKHKTKQHVHAAPNLSSLGVMLPSSPLQHLLVHELGAWLVVTSANHRGEPMYTDDVEAERQLSDVVDGILCNNRPIAHLADDSLVRLVGEQQIVLRHARGLAPTEIPMLLKRSNGIGYGGHSKAAFAIKLDNRLILSQHIGDLDSSSAVDVFKKEMNSFEKLYGINHCNSKIACDVHPYYTSTKLAFQRKSPEQIPHHEAHLESLIVESNFSGKALGIVCDGTGLGADGTIWGGEFFLIDGKYRRRVASLLPFRLPGGESAVKEPRKTALGMLHETLGKNALTHPFATNAFTSQELSILGTVLTKGFNAPYTSSLGRLFDGLASLLGLLSFSDYEAQAPLLLEAKAHQNRCPQALPIRWLLDNSGIWRWDWRNLIPLAIESSISQHDCFSASFHATIVQVAVELTLRFKVSTILVTGGVFQNAALLELFQELRVTTGISVICHDRVPPGDGGLALGQLAVAHRLEEKGCV